MHHPIETSLFRLKPLKSKDVNALYSFRQQASLEPYKPSAKFSKLEACKAEAKEASLGQRPAIWLLESKETRALIAELHIATDKTDEQQVDLELMSPSGLSLEHSALTFNELLKYLFRSLSKNKVKLFIQQEHTQQKELARLIKMQHEVCFRDHKLIAGNWKNFDMYSILQREWSYKSV